MNTYIIFLAGLLVFIICGSTRNSGNTESCSNTPNVLLIAIDDLNNWVGYLEGHPQVKTPHMDRLAERGIAFTNAHCTTPLCMPSRTAILSGLSETKTNVYRNGDNFKYKEYTLIPQYFADHNYVTYGAGKIHHKNINDQIFQISVRPEPNQRWSPFNPGDVKYTEEELPSKGTDNPYHLIENGPGGLDYVLPFNRMSSERSPNNTKGESFDWASFDLPDNSFGDGFITGWALEMLHKHQSERPFFMAIGYYRPHIPLYAPKKYFDMYPLESIQLPEVIKDDLSDIPEPGKKRALSAVTAGTHQHVIAHNQWKEAVQAYLACVSFIDARIGELLDYLDNSPYANNTVIVMYSDHGWHLGEKEAWGKFSGWIHSTNTPFIICAPDIKNGSLCHNPVSLLDIYPTLIDLAGLPDRELDGVSLVPLLNDPGIASQRVVKTYVGAGNYSLSSNQWRYIHYEDGSEELYNIQEDPREYNNLIGSSDYHVIIEGLKSNVH